MDEMAEGRPERVPPCPRWREDDDCSGLWTWKGTVGRGPLRVTSEERLEEGFELRQCLCKLHGRYRAYPSFVLPRRHYAASTVEAALEAHARGASMEGVCAASGVHEASTPRRWIRQFRHHLVSIVEAARRRVRALSKILLADSESAVPSPPRQLDSYGVWEHLGLLSSLLKHVPPLLRPSRCHLVVSL